MLIYLFFLAFETNHYLNKNKISCQNFSTYFIGNKVYNVDDELFLQLVHNFTIC